MLVYVDESGDTGFKFDTGSSRRFVVVAVVFANQSDADACSEAINRLRAALKWHPNYEFKFNRSDEATRRRFLKTITVFPFRYYAFALNKPRLMDGALRKKDQMYTRVVQWVFENAMKSLKDAEVVFDSRGERTFYVFLEKFLKSVVRINNCHDAISSVRAVDSHSENLLQMADMICGALNRYYSDKPDAREYLPLVAGHSARTRYWP